MRVGFVQDIDRLNSLQGVCDGTLGGYNRCWHFWVNYLTARGQLDVLFLRGVPVIYARAIVANFVVWFAKSQCRSETQIAHTFSGTRYTFLKVGENADVFADSLVALAKRTFRETSRETLLRRLTGINGKIRMPACSAFLETLKGEQMVLASSFMFNFGVRLCNVGYDPKSKGKHAVRRRDIVFEDISGRRFNLPQYACYLRSISVWGDSLAMRARVKCLIVFYIAPRFVKRLGVQRYSVDEVNRSLSSWMSWSTGRC